MHRSNAFRRCTAFLSASLLAATATANSQCDDVRAQSARVELNLGSVVAPIVHNAGQWQDDVTHGALGASGSGAHFHANGRACLVMMSKTDNLRFGFTPVETDGQPLIETASLLTGGVHYHGAAAPGRLDAWEALEMRGLYGQAVLTHRLTGRTWRLHASGPASDLDRMAWAPMGVASAVADERSGDLVLTLDDLDHGEAQTIVVHPARVVADDGVAAYLPFVTDDEGTIRLSGPVQEGATLEMVVVFAPYFHGGDAVADGRGGFVAVGPTVEARHGDDSDSNGDRDIAVIRTGADGRTFQGMTVLASSGDDRPTGIASHGGTAFVTAQLGAADGIAWKGAQQAKGQVWPAPVAVRVETDGAISGGQLLTDLGLTDVRDVAVDAEGRVLVTGAATGTVDASSTLDVISVWPVATDAGIDPVVHAYALVELDGGLHGTGRAQSFTGAASGWPVRISVDCSGHLTVGLELVSATALQCTGLFPTWRPASYEANAPSPDTAWVDGYTLFSQSGFPWSRWGFHALLWKYYNHAFPPPYDAAAADASTAPPIPLGQIAFLDSNRLNAMEANPAIFPQGDPAGGWQANTATSSLRGLEAALGAAAYASFWNSPTYTNLQLDSGAPSTDGVGIMEVTFCNKTPNWQGPLAICQNALPSGLPIDVFDADCVAQGGPVTNNGQIFLDEVRLHEWYTQAGLIHQDRMPGHAFKTRFELASPGGIYIGDPPDNARFAAGHVQEAVAREMAAVVVDVPVAVTRYVDGEASEASEGLGVARAVDQDCGG